MTIQVDTREKKKEWERISKQFDGLGVDYYRSKLYVGDYMNLDNPRLVIDRKKDLQELCGNVTQQHERFRAELIRAQKSGIKVITLGEHGDDIIKTAAALFLGREGQAKQLAQCHLGEDESVFGLGERGLGFAQRHFDLQHLGTGNHPLIVGCLYILLQATKQSRVLGG